MQLTPERARGLLAKTGAILEGHFVGTSGKHLSVYVAKDRGTRLTSVASELCEGIAELFVGDDIDVVVAPAVGGIALSQWTAHHLTRLRPDRAEVLALYSEREEEVLAERGENDKPPLLRIIPWEDLPRELVLTKGQKLVVVKPSLTLKRGFAGDVRGKRVLEVEDILTTGSSAKRTAEAIVQAGGILVGVGVLANGGGVTAADLGVPRLEALMTVNRQIFTEAECADHGLCAKDVLINTEFGHGAEFLARQKKKAT